MVQTSNESNLSALIPNLAKVFSTTKCPGSGGSITLTNSVWLDGGGSRKKVEEHRRVVSRLLLQVSFS